MANDEVGRFYMVYPFIVSILISPVIGYGVDKNGKHRTWACLGCIISLLANISLAISDDSHHRYAIFSAICWGFSQSISFIVSNGSLISVIIDEEYLGTAYGIHFAFQAVLETVLYLAFGGYLKSISVAYADNN